MKFVFASLFCLHIILTNATSLFGQTITQEVSKITLMKYDYFRDKDNSLISLINYRIYTFPDSVNSTYKLIISTIEPKKIEVGNSNGVSANSVLGTLNLGVSFNTFYSRQIMEGVCEVSDKNIPKLVALFNSILRTTGEFKVASSKQKLSSLLITETFDNLTFGSELKTDGVNYYFKIDKATFILSESEFVQIAKFIAKVKSS